MKRNALLPIMTYPDATSKAAATNSVRMAAQLNCGVHALVVTVRIPEISNAWSRILVDTPEMIRKAEAASGESGEELLAEITARGDEYGVPITSEIINAAPAFLGDAAAAHARYFDMALVGWQANDETSRLAAEAVVFGSGRPTNLCPRS